MLSEKKFKKILKTNYNFTKKEIKLITSYLYLFETLEHTSMYEGFQDGLYAFHRVGDMLALECNLSDDEFNQIFNVFYGFGPNNIKSREIPGKPKKLNLSLEDEDIEKFLEEENNFQFI